MSDDLALSRLSLSSTLRALHKQRRADRISHLRSIDHDAAVLPKGAFIVDASHAVSKNKAYPGLSYEAAGNMANYFHFRKPESARASAGLEKPGIVRAGDFMDPIAEDSPAGVWSLSYDTSSQIACLRSFYWPGYFFYHVIESPEYGGVYFGDVRRISAERSPSGRPSAARRRRSMPMRDSP